MSQVCIIGASGAGLMAAELLAERGHQVVVIEQDEFFKNEAFEREPIKIHAPKIIEYTAPSDFKSGQELRRERRKNKGKNRH